IPEDNFYRRLKSILDLRFLYRFTKKYYGDCGQKSIDPVVFFKLMLVGYLENIISDRKLIQHCSMRMDILFFLGYDIDEPLVWHSTISRTRDVFPSEVFDEVFDKILRMCVEAGMVSGHTQAIDSAPVKANASMESLELKVPADTLDEHLRKVRYMSTPDRKVKENKASQEQQTITATERQLKEIKSRNKKWKKDQDERPGAKNNNAKYTSNHTHYSPTDPDARISVKPGKARKLNYLSQLAVDTAEHVITHIGADHANKKDNQCLQSVTLKLKKRLEDQGMIWRNLIADTGYSSGVNYAFLEETGLLSYIPPHGTYKGGPEGFEYDKENNCWLCPEGKIATFRKTHTQKDGIKKNLYLTKRSDCKGCPIKIKCIAKSHEKKIDITYYREEYERAIARIKSKRGRYMKTKRQSTVEPVFGTLTQFMGMRKVNTRGIDNANKVMMMAAIAYNLKKYLKFTKNKVETVAKHAKETGISLFDYFCQLLLLTSPNNRIELTQI
ncbi:MAG: IS1182 family transposase, partial [Bacteroidia bacterium]|nr:IS1182 family transposase [Bacteroidia bacterium]